MSTEDLRDELARIGDRAPVVDVPDDTFASAQRARRRDRLAVVAAVVAVVALAGGLAARLPDRSGPDPADSDRSGVPNHLWAPPSSLGGQDEKGNWTSDRVETDLDIGPAAVAWLTDAGLPVVVSAVDGNYHPVALPDQLHRTDLMLASMSDTSPLALSPDGTQLAYGWAGEADGAPRRPSGVNVVDLTTGELRTIAIDGGGVQVHTIVWSPDGRWLAWSGLQMADWGDSDADRARGAAAGRIAPRATESVDVPVRRWTELALAVDDDGAVTMVESGRINRWDDRPSGSVRAPVGRISPTAVAIATGRRLLVGVGANGPTDNPMDGSRLGTIVTATTGELTRLLGGSVGDWLVTTRPLGWVDETAVLLVDPRAADETVDLGEREIVFAAPGERSRSLVTVESGVPNTLSVAVGLMTKNHPTVERPEPDWPWSEERWSITIGLGVAALLSLVYGVRWLWRRRQARSAR